MNIKKLFLGNTFVFNENEIRKSANAFLLISILQTVVFICHCFYRYQSGLFMITADVADFPVKTFQSINTNYGFFVTGLSGKLYINNADFFQILLLNEIAKFNLADIVYILVVGILLCKTIRKLNTEIIFHQYLISTFLKIGLLTSAMWMIQVFYQIFIQAKIIEHLTSHQFTAYTFQTNQMYLLIGSIICIISYFFRKAFLIEQENSLTI